MCDVLVDTSILVVGETSLLLVGIYSVSVASDSSHVVTNDSVVSLELHWGVVFFNLCGMWGTVVQIWGAGSSLIVEHVQHTSCGLGLSLVALY